MIYPSSKLTLKYKFLFEKMIFVLNTVEQENKLRIATLISLLAKINRNNNGKGVDYTIDSTTYHIEQWLYVKPLEKGRIIATRNNSIMSLSMGQWNSTLPVKIQQTTTETESTSEITAHYGTGFRYPEHYFNAPDYWKTAMKILRSNFCSILKCISLLCIRWCTGVDALTVASVTQ